MIHYIDIKNYTRLLIFFQVQIEVMQKRQKEKKAMMSAVKKYQKGNVSCLV